MTVRVRFAPSPTGHLHLASVNRALLNWLFARRHGGVFVLRIDDTDLERSKPEYDASIRDILSWLGMNWDEEYYQSKRLDRYQLAFEKLKAAGRLYPCFETSEELDMKRKVQLMRGLPPVYDRAARSLTPADIEQKIARGETPHWRFLLDLREVTWDDMCRGKVEYHTKHISDPILFKGNGQPLYSLASVVDDVELNITHVIRGEDHVVNAVTQVQIFEALGAPVPTMGHFPIFLDQEGHKMSKRTGSVHAIAFREAGIEPETMLSVMEAIGTSHAPKMIHSAMDLVKDFDIQAYGRSAPRYDPDEMWPINAKILHNLSYATVAPRLAKRGLNVSPEFWQLIAGNVDTLNDAGAWWTILTSPLPPHAEPLPAWLPQAADLLPAGEITDEAWATWTKQLKADLGVSGRPMFMALRRALTGREDGPQLPAIVRYLGREQTIKRLKATH